MIKTRIFEQQGIFISIIFARNLNRKPAWNFRIENVEDLLYESTGRFYDYNECEIEALKKATEFL